MSTPRFAPGKYLLGKNQHGQAVRIQWRICDESGCNVVATVLRGDLQLCERHARQRAQEAERPTNIQVMPDGTGSVFLKNPAAYLQHLQRVAQKNARIDEFLNKVRRT